MCRVATDFREAVKNSLVNEGVPNRFPEVLPREMAYPNTFFHNIRIQNSVLNLADCPRVLYAGGSHAI